MPAYDARHFQPPAPAARVVLRNPDTGASCTDVLMLLDTGADVSLVPRTALDSLGITPTSQRFYEPVGFTGDPTLSPVVLLEMRFCEKTFRGQFLPVDQPWGILGRNVLNAVSLLLDGPRAVWAEHRA
ncbi:MAG: hypothetical protein HY321_20800 [Armatimonadetes bacterium]|nr:hypothetical protein [Armatimonadota bacterium]